MAYRIDPGPSVGAEVRRALGEQLGRAAHDLRAPGGPSAEAVHQARRRIKKSRSLLRLARADLGAGVVRHANAELRTVGTALSTQRDADALVETLDQLADPELTDPGLAGSIAAVRVALVARADAVRAGPSLDRTTLLGAARVLERLVRWTERVPSRAEGWSALGPGMARQHARGRTAFHALGDEPTPEELHEWRKRVKDLWYQERLLRRLWPDAQRPVILAADELADTLGFDHDLALLVALLGTDDDDDVTDEPIGRVGATDRVRVATAATERRRELQVRARRLGALLYADTAKAWQRRHGAWWEAALADRAPDQVTA